MYMQAYKKKHTQCVYNILHKMYLTHTMCLTYYIKCIYNNRVCTLECTLNSSFNAFQMLSLSYQLI